MNADASSRSAPGEKGQDEASIGFAYFADGLATQHSCAFLRDRRFIDAYRAGIATLGRDGESMHIEWRVHVALWAAQQAAAREGDFVECGVNTGILSRAIVQYLDFARMAPRRFYLVDTFRGIPIEQYTAPERERGIDRAIDGAYKETLQQVTASFASFPNVVIVPGIVPHVLPLVVPERVAYLSIDMNAALPEIAAARHFWPRLVSGGVMLLDDYGWQGHDVQKRAFDDFAAERNVPILQLPTGQGLVVKP